MTKNLVFKFGGLIEFGIFEIDKGTFLSITKLNYILNYYFFYALPFVLWSLVAAFTSLFHTFCKQTLDGGNVHVVDVV